MSETSGIGDPHIVETIGQLEWMAGRLASEPRIGVDMESNSFYAYREKVCLLQISSATEDFVIDPLAVKDMSPISHLFRDPAVEKIFHAGEYDILCLKRDFGYSIANVFDTMVASRTLGSKKLGLAALIEERFGVKLSKKLQRADWGRRPLTWEHIEYARMDTHYLLRLRDMLHAELEAKDRLEDAKEEFRRLEALEPEDKPFDPDAWWRLPGAKELSAQARSVLKELYLYRESRAAALDRAPFRVMPEDLLVRLAKDPPRDPGSLSSRRGMTPYLMSHFGRGLLEAVERGLAAPPIEAPPERARERPDNGTLRRYEALRRWRKEAADKRGVEPVVILATDEVRRLASAPAATEASEDPKAWLDCLSPYKKGLYGEELLRILTSPVQPSGARKRRRRRRK